MSDLARFLTSKEIIIVYTVSFTACLLVFIIYLVEKNNTKMRQKHNTRELNKLVEEIKDETKDEQVEVLYDEPVLEKIEDVNEASSVVELIDSVSSDEKIKNNSDDKEQIIVEDSNKIVEEEQLEYTTIEPDQETARLELKKLTEELKRQEEREKEERIHEELKIQEESQIEEKTMEVSNNIDLTNYEVEQEENAIISLEELVQKSKAIYEANELTQYADEGNEPISLQELEKRVGQQTEQIEEPFIIENVVLEDEKVEQKVQVESETQSLRLDDFNTIEEIKTEGKKFKSSPIISPIYGIEKKDFSDTDIELENTANYDKFDEEIKKTNEFLMTLRELQKKLD